MESVRTSFWCVNYARNSPLSRAGGPTAHPTGSRDLGQRIQHPALGGLIHVEAGRIFPADQSALLLQMRRVVFEIGKRRYSTAHHLIFADGGFPLIEHIRDVYIYVWPETFGVFPVVRVKDALNTAVRWVARLH